MIEVLRGSWALLLGMLLLMLGNGLQSTLLGVRGAIEGFSALEMSVVMSGYFVGFLGGSRLAPELIRRVGHVRVFAALGSLISAALVLYAAVPDPWAWTGFRVIVGFCFSGVYVTAESWLNNSASNENRGKALSLYMVVQMAGIVAAQGLLNLGDASGFVLFVIASVLVSVAFTPILLSVTPAPVFEATKPMSLRALVRASPLGAVGMLLSGGVFAAMFGMSAVYGTQAGLSVAQISAFVSAIFAGGLVCQYPIGWLSDRTDRRRVIAALAGGAGFALLLPFLVPPSFPVLLALGFVLGGATNPLYALLMAHTNDFLAREDMAAASGGMIFLNGVGAVTGPLVLGWAMDRLGPDAFFGYVALMLLATAAYALWRMTRRPRAAVADRGTFAPVLPTVSPVAVELRQEIAAERAQQDDTAGQPAQAVDKDRKG